MWKGVLQFGFVLFWTIMWATGSSEAEETTEVSEESRLLPQFFNWSHIGPDYIELSWDVEKLGERYADVIRVTATGVTYFYFGMNFTSFSDGNITLHGLRPNSTYTVSVEGLSIVGSIFNSTELITTSTKSTGGNTVTASTTTTTVA